MYLLLKKMKQLLRLIKSFLLKLKAHRLIYLKMDKKKRMRNQLKKQGVLGERAIL